MLLMFRFLFHVLALLPLGLLAWDFSQGNLTANPIREVQFRTGRYALLLLVLSLAGTPLYTVFGLRPAVILRRPLGLYAFFYASLHFLNFIWLDYGFNLALLREDILEKRFALVGFAAYLLLLPLAVTSTEGWRKRLGVGWKRLHRLVYPAAILAVLHYAWQVRVDYRPPLIYGVVVLLLLVLRLPWVRRVLHRW